MEKLIENVAMKNYDFVEGADFEGMVPKVINDVGGIGSGSSVAFMGVAALGSDPLEVVDFAPYIVPVG